MRRGRGRGARRGSALILVLMMTLAVAGLSIAAIFLSSSAGLLSRFYDRERDFRLAAEAALAQLRSRLPRDSTIAIPDTGMVQLLAGFRPPDAAGVASDVRVNVYAATTGDTTGLETPHVTLVAAAYDANGTRHVRRMDLRRQSFSRYGFFVDSFSASYTFGPGTVQGRVHTNQTWRTGTGGGAATYLDTVSAVTSLVGGATYSGDTITAVPTIPYPSDSTYPRLDTLATAADLKFAPYAASGPGWQGGSRLEFVTVDADADGTIAEDEGFARVFDLGEGMDTTNLRTGMDQSFSVFSWSWHDWQSRTVQSQCGAWYLRSGRWHFFPVATHRAAWAQATGVIQATGSANYPQVTSPAMTAMAANTRSATAAILSQATSRCYPGGSPYLVTAERFTNDAGVVTGGAADTIPFGVVTPPGGWPAAGPYGGADTTFTPRSRTCDIGATGLCVSGSVRTLGAWRAFAGTAVTGIATTIRQDAELPYLWPFDPSRNPESRRVIHATAGPLYVSGRVRGKVTLVVGGAVDVIDELSYGVDPTDPSATACSNQLGLVAVGDILVADNGITRGRIIGSGPYIPPIFTSQSFPRHLGGTREVVMHGSFMSLGGTVGIENYSATGEVPQACPVSGSANTSAGCLRTTGALVMRRFTPHYSGSNTGARYLGMRDPCQTTDNRPPFFPLTNRYTLARTLEVEPSLANTPAKVRTLLMRLKGKPL